MPRQQQDKMYFCTLWLLTAGEHNFLERGTEQVQTKTTSHLGLQCKYQEVGTSQAVKFVQRVDPNWVIHN